jgi:serine carboxypeptidase 1
MRFAVAILCVAAVAVSADQFPGSFYGYLPTHNNSATMFYSIQNNASVERRSSMPLTVFLQGGPGASSQFSQWFETGTMKLEVDPSNSSGWRLVPRKHAWTRHSTMLYVDSPVGTGWSQTSEFCTTDQCNADDLVTFFRGFFKRHAEFQSVPLFLFSESYGGKMIAFAAAALLDADPPVLQPGQLKAVEIGDGWVSGIDCMKSYGAYMKAFSLLNDQQARLVDALAAQAEAKLNEGDGFGATSLWGEQQQVFDMMSGGVNVYNVNTYYSDPAENLLDPFMNSAQFRKDIAGGVPNPNFQFDSQGGRVFSRMGNAFLMSGVEKVDYLLNKGIKVYVLSGQVDLIVDSLCIERWMQTLQWPGLTAFNSAPRQAISLDPNAADYHVDLYIQQYSNLNFVSVTNSGHMLPLYTPASAEYFFTWILAGGQLPPERQRRRRMDKLGRIGRSGFRYGVMRGAKKP